jgi:hypothetical protein
MKERTHAVTLVAFGGGSVIDIGSLVAPHRADVTRAHAGVRVGAPDTLQWALGGSRARAQSRWPGPTADVRHPRRVGDLPALATVQR